ncbi:PEP-CTERM sorting domain-containing protein [Candidatus Omnitrophota bacterium]
MLATGLMLFTLTVAPTPAFALLTWVNPLGGGDGSETSLIAGGGILDSLYGLANLKRIDDVVDQIWQNPGSSTAEAIAKHATNTQTLYAGPHLIFTIDGTGLGTAVTFTSAQSGAVFKFYDDPNGALDPPKWSSVPSENVAFSKQAAGLDRMVTWEIIGTSGGFGSNVIGNHVIGWEDKDDQDYNDIVFELANVYPVPEPTSMLLLGIGLVGLAGGKARKRFKV